MFHILIVRRGGGKHWTGTFGKFVWHLFWMLPSQYKEFHSTCPIFLKLLVWCVWMTWLRCPFQYLLDVQAESGDSSLSIPWMVEVGRSTLKWCPEGTLCRITLSKCIAKVEDLLTMHCSHMEWGPKFVKMGTKWGPSAKEMGTKSPNGD